MFCVSGLINQTYHIFVFCFFLSSCSHYKRVKLSVDSKPGLFCFINYSETYFHKVNKEE